MGQQIALTSSTTGNSVLNYMRQWWLNAWGIDLNALHEQIEKDKANGARRVGTTPVQAARICWITPTSTLVIMYT